MASKIYRPCRSFLAQPQSVCASALCCLFCCLSRAVRADDVGRSWALIEGRFVTKHDSTTTVGMKTSIALAVEHSFPVQSESRVGSIQFKCFHSMLISQSTSSKIPFLAAA